MSRLYLGALALLALSLSLAAGCREPITEVVIEVSSDLAIPTAIDGLVIDVMRAGGAVTSSEARLGEGEPALPRTLTLVYRGGALGPIEIEARATLGGVTVVSARRIVSFVAGRRVILHVDLDGACAAAACLLPLTCADDGRCRDPLVTECELDPAACTDASVADGGEPDGADLGDAGTDPIDGGPGCVLDRGLCAPTVSMLGDTVDLTPCETSAGVTVTYRTEGPSGIPSTDSALVMSATGEYVVTATASSPAACTTIHSIMVDAFEATAEVGRPGAVRRNLAARPGMAFVATDRGPWAVTRAGWRDLRVGATGTAVVNDFATVVVRDGDAFFGGEHDEPEVVRVETADDFSGLAITSVLIPEAGDRTFRAMAVPPGMIASGDLGPVLLGTKDGLALLTGPGDALASSTLGPPFEIEYDVAMSASEPSTRGAVWALDHDRRLRNVATGTGLPFAGGAAVAPGAASPRALAVDDRGTTRRLVLCTDDRGILIFDLDLDWSALTTMPAPIATVPSVMCRDIALGGEGDFWAATTRGLYRIGSDGTVRHAPTPSDGIGVIELERVATAWNATTREVWVLARSGSVFVTTAP